MPPEFPATADAVTAAWLTDALRASGAAAAGAEVCEVAATSVGTGQMGTSVRFALRWEPEGAGPASVVGKFASADPQSRATALALRTYEVEVCFYRSVARTVGIRTPQCHAAGIDTASGDFVLLLEDLAPAEQGDQMRGCTLAEAEIAIDELAKLHGPRWGDERLAALPWLHRNTPEALATSAAILPALLPGFLDRYACRLAPEHAHAAERLMASLGAWLRDREPPFAVLHGDYRTDNMLFGGRKGGAPLAVVDWQTAAWGPPMADVAYFLGGSLPTELRRRHERALVRRYLDAVAAAGGGGLPWERAWRDYRKLAFGGLLMAICASMMVMQTPRGDDMFVTMARRHATHVFDLDALALLGS